MSKEDNPPILFIMNQTNYDYETAYAKLLEHNGNYINAVKEYMGIPLQPKSQSIHSINQEIYKQIRKELDSGMRIYNNKNPIDTEDVINKFQQYQDK